MAHYLGQALASSHSIPRFLPIALHPLNVSGICDATIVPHLQNSQSTSSSTFSSVSSGSGARDSAKSLMTGISRCPRKRDDNAKEQPAKQPKRCFGQLPYCVIYTFQPCHPTPLTLLTCFNMETSSIPKYSRISHLHQQLIISFYRPFQICLILSNL
ncbi:hypothetical protein PENTCL1PPCAC_3081 [Pristionchus entomophagus]|uniref:Uncharacterized protein n=1 Tax=Pristionchus entomophagus TaxID=358040 RepID=A0AAV5SC46_9BILA|nr:hypothetical protein PENTCL1PPCAC_3081 [Pristionchus entomophagus]